MAEDFGRAGSGNDERKMLRLVCVSGMNKNDEFPVMDGKYVIGRNAACDIVVFDKQVSRRHCEFFKRGRYQTVEDLNSRHGTYVNGKQITKREIIELGDQIKLGHTRLVLSDKPVDTALGEAEAAAQDLEVDEYRNLITKASVDVAKTSQMRKESVQVATGKKGFLRALFGKK